MQPDWDKLKKEYKDTPNVVIGDADCSGNAQSFCAGQGVQGYPTLKLLIGGRYQDFQGARSFDALKREVETKLNPRPACSLESKDACSKEDRAILEESEQMSKAQRAAKIKAIEAEAKEKREKAKQLEKEAKALTASLELIKAGGAKVEKVEQLLNDEDTKAHCEDRTCIIAFLPHILDDQSAERKRKIGTVSECLAATKKDGRNFGFLWSQGGDQFEAEETLGLQFGFPAVVAINYKKSIFGIHRGTFDTSSVTQFMTSLGRGGAHLVPIPGGLKFSKADPWDGKDGEPLPEEDL